MHIEIRKLTPDLLEDYLYFFENSAHEDNEEEDRCYCVGWCSDDYEGKDFSSPQVRRNYAIQYIKSGTIQGYLAYCDGQVIGWCNANCRSECLKCDGWRRCLVSVNTNELTPNVKVKSIFCFTIAPDMKRSGIATQLLERVCKDAADDGYDIVEAYPNKKFVDVFQDFMGPIDLYKKCGFVVYDETEQKIVMRKQLK